MDGFKNILETVMSLAIGFFIILPLAIWKLIDIIIWLIKR